MGEQRSGPIGSHGGEPIDKPTPGTKANEQSQTFSFSNTSSFSVQSLSTDQDVSRSWVALRCAHYVQIIPSPAWISSPTSFFFAITWERFSFPPQGV